MSNCNALEDVSELLANMFETVLLEGLIEIRGMQHYCLILKISFKYLPEKSEPKIFDINKNLYVISESRLIRDSPPSDEIKKIIEGFKDNGMPLRGRNGSEIFFRSHDFPISFEDRWKEDSDKLFSSAEKDSKYSNSILKTRYERLIQLIPKDLNKIKVLLGINPAATLTSGIVIVLPILNKEKGIESLNNMEYFVEYSAHTLLVSNLTCVVYLLDSLESTCDNNAISESAFYLGKSVKINPLEKFTTIKIPLPYNNINSKNKILVRFKHPLLGIVRTDIFGVNLLSSPKVPPLGLNDILHLAWGLTMNLSGQEKQVELGKDVREFWKAFLPNYSSQDIINKKQDNLVEKNEDINPDSEDKEYLGRIFAILSTYLRSTGFEKDVYDKYLDAQTNRRAQSTKYWDDIADFTSLSKDGLILRIAGFFGIGGSILTTTKLINLLPGGSIFSSIQKNASQTLLDAAQSLNIAADKLTNKSFVVNLLNTESSNLKGKAESLNQTLPSDLVVFLIAGFVGLLSVIIFLRWYKTRRLRSIYVYSLEEQQNYWEKIARPSYRQSLLHLARDVALIIHRYYEEYYEAHVKTLNVAKIVEEILPKVDLYANTRYIFTWPEDSLGKEKEIQGRDKDRIIEHLADTVLLTVGNENHMDKIKFRIRKTGDHVKISYNDGNEEIEYCKFTMVNNHGRMKRPKCYLEINNDKRYEYIVIKKRYEGDMKETALICSRVI